MVRKLGAYPRQNGLAQAIREVGRLERSLFMLQWLQDFDLRRRVQVGLNKGEARNALAKAVFFNRLGEVRERSYEDQCYRASGLNLVVAAIILWNTVYLERTVDKLRALKLRFPEELATHLSPLAWRGQAWSTQINARPPSISSQSLAYNFGRIGERPPFGTFMFSCWTAQVD